MEKKERILSEAFKQLSTKGIEATKVEDIASALQMSKKTIYLRFRTKEEIILQTGLWKLKSIADKAQSIVASEEPVVTKLVLYIDCIYVNLSDVSLPMINNFLSKREKADGMMNDYLHSAVFERFNSLLEQAESEERLNMNTDHKSNLVMYWETLSTFLFARPIKSIPKSLKLDIPINQMLCNQLINLFRGFLNTKGIEEFDEELKKHHLLSTIFT